MAYLYRGTTAGWPGNPCLQREKLTPTSTDPLVATLFGIECLRWGRAVLLLADRLEMIGLMTSENVLAEMEQEIVVMVSPSEFAEQHACGLVPVEQARQALHQLGYPLPAVISSRESLNEELKIWRRLRDDEVARFDTLIHRSLA